MTSNRPLEEWGKLLGDVPTAGAILDRFRHHAQTITSEKSAIGADGNIQVRRTGLRVEEK